MITKKYNLFNFFTTFAKTLVEVFIPLILYNSGIELKMIFVFLLLTFGLNIILSPLVTKIGERIGFKWMIFLSTFVFIGLYYYLLEYNNIYILAILHSLNTTLYYIGKHNYASVVLAKDEKHLGKGVGSFLIVSILATIPAGLIGAQLIERISTKTSVIITLIIYLIGVFPLFFIKYENHKHDKLITMIKKTPPKNFIFFTFTQFKSIYFLLFPLYVLINVKNNYSYIGLLNMIVGIASIIFIKILARKMDKNKKDYMLFSGILLGVILLSEISIKGTIFLLFMSFFEGIATKLYETSNARNFYFIDKSYDKACYFLMSELLNNAVKFMIILFALLFNLKLYVILVIMIIGIILSGIIKFEEPELSKKNNKKT